MSESANSSTAVQQECVCIFVFNVFLVVLMFVQIEATKQENSPETADSLKEKGNNLYRQQKYQSAIQMYDEAIAIKPSAPLYLNRAICEYFLENFGTCIENSTKSLELDPKYVKAYYRRAMAYFQLKRLPAAIEDLKTIVKLDLKSSFFREQLEMCRKAYRTQQFSEAISHPDYSVCPRIEEKVPTVKIPETYAGPELTFPITPDNLSLSFVTENIVPFMRQDGVIAKRYMFQTLLQVHSVLKNEPTIVSLTLPKEGVTVVGDMHGQFYDLLHIFALNGFPSEHNVYVFNGDYVDRGSFSLQVITLLFLLKILFPEHLILLRGNHESDNMNQLYGFNGECEEQYKHDKDVYLLFKEVFNCLPLGCVISDEEEIRKELEDDAQNNGTDLDSASAKEKLSEKTRVFCVHGGIPSFAALISVFFIPSFFLFHLFGCVYLSVYSCIYTFISVYLSLFPFSKDGETIENLQKINRFKQPPENEPNSSFSDLLWTDPHSGTGRIPSPRGMSQMYGLCFLFLVLFICFVLFSVISFFFLFLCYLVLVCVLFV